MSKKRVYVTWPTDHRTGPHPYVVVREGYKIQILFENGEKALVPSSWVEEVQLELEPDRLYYFWDNAEDFSEANIGINVDGVWQHYEPVHKRWKELSDEDRDYFKLYINVHHDLNCYVTEAMRLYKSAYMLLTGEEHP